MAIGEILTWLERHVMKLSKNGIRKHNLNMDENLQDMNVVGTP